MSTFLVNKFKQYFFADKPTVLPGEKSVSDLNYSFNIKQSFELLKEYEFTKSEIAHYGFLSLVILFAFIIAPANFLIKLVMASLFLTILAMPITSQFFLNALPILAWLALFFVTGKIPADYRPPISVKVLPAIETIFYGDNLSDVLATFTAPALDIIAWLPYGMIHFALPFILAGLLFLFGPPKCLRAYAFAFGYMNLIGVLTQILFPAAPPWYKIINGLAPANYSMGGSPGGLGRIDELLGIDMYTSTFTNAPVPFGAFPSLHSGCATMEAMFLSYIFPSFSFVWWGYVLWLWWCTMYLTHHYFIDLMAGAVLTFSIFTYTKYNHLPIVSKNKFCRWSYANIQLPDIKLLDPLNFNSYNRLDSYGNDIENNFQSDYEIDDSFEMGSLASRSSISSSTTSLNFMNGNLVSPRIVSRVFEDNSDVIHTGHMLNSPSISSLASASPSLFENQGQSDAASIASSSKTSIDLNFNAGSSSLSLSKSSSKRD